MTRPLRLLLLLPSAVSLPRPARLRPPPLLSHSVDSALPSLAAPLDAVLPIFSLYSVDLLASCEFLCQSLSECSTDSCEIYPVDDVPRRLADVDMAESVVRDLDTWSRWDVASDDSYYSTMEWGEEYTGYDGREVWRVIHEVIQFSDSGDFAWKADFNRLLGGLHAMVSAQVVRGMWDKAQTGESISSATVVAEYQRRLGVKGENQGAVDNMYFALLFLIAGVARVRERLMTEGREWCENDNHEARQALESIVSHALWEDPQIQIVTHQWRDQVKLDIDNLWQARMRTRDLMRVMNCVQCNKCRFHGKIATLGLTTAIQLVVGGHDAMGEDVNKIRRVELAALVTTMGKFVKGIQLCWEMEQLLKQQQQQ